MRPGAALAVCLLAAAAAGQQAPKDAAPTPALRAQRFARELELPEQRSAAVDALLLLGADGVPALLQQAEHPDLATARTALQVIAALSHDGLAAVPKLRELATGDSPHAHAAAWTLARLPHRGTFLVPLRQGGVVIELDAGGKEIWRSKRVGMPWAASILDNGNLLVTDLGGSAREYDRGGNKIAELGGPCTSSAERLIDGNTLVSEFFTPRIVEYDATGNEVWSRRRLSALWTTRLANGRTLIACYGDGRLLEVDHTGEVQWQIGDCNGPQGCQRNHDGSVWIWSPQRHALTKVGRDGKQLAELRMDDDVGEAVKLPNGTIQSGDGFVRRCAEKGEQTWRTEITGQTGRITLR